MEASGENLPAIIADIFLFGQFFVYYAAIFFYCRKKLKYFENDYSDSDYVEMKWTPRFLIMFFVVFFIIFVAYMINPRIDTWFAPILTMIAMTYLVYVVIFHSTVLYLSRLPDFRSINGNEKPHSSVEMSTTQMKDICDKIVEYLQNSKAYTNPDFSINMLSQEMRLHPREVSLAINGYLHQNFFNFVNKMRVEEAKRLLCSQTSAITTDSVYPECGFSSRSSFYMVFKKIEKTTPAQWKKNNT